MATNPQRAQAIADAVLNAAATQAQVNRLAASLAASEGREAEYSAMSAADKATYFVTHIRKYCVNAVRGRDVSLATAAAAATAIASTNQEFPEP